MASFLDLSMSAVFFLTPTLQIRCERLIRMLCEMAYAISVLTPFITHDGAGACYGFGEDLREFVYARLDKVDPYRESEEVDLQMNSPVDCFPNTWAR